MQPNASDLIAQARALAREALCAERGIDPPYALHMCDRAIKLLEPIAPSEMLADVLRWKGTILRDCGDLESALDLYAQSLAVADATAYVHGRAHALNCFGTIAQLRSDLHAATGWYRSAKDLAQGLHDRRLSGMIEQNLAISAATAGKPLEALNHFLVALELFEAEGAEQASLWVLNNLGNLYTRQGSYELAADALRRALALAERLGDVATEGIVEENRARLQLATGKYADAEETATRALGLAAQRLDCGRQAAAILVLARAKRRLDPSAPEIRALLDIALNHAANGADAELRSEILSDMAEASDQGGDQAKAALYRKEAADISGSRTPARPPSGDWLAL